MAKKEPLQVGQHVFLQELSYFSKPSEPREYEVVRANGTSAYATPLDLVDGYKSGKTSYSVKIEQRTRKASNLISNFNFWESKEAYDNAMNHKKEYNYLIGEAAKIIKDMTFDELKSFVESKGV